MKATRLAFSKPLLTFCAAVVGRPRSARVNVTNRADEPVELVDSIAFGEGLTAWILGVRRLAPGRSTVVTITYEPTAAGRLVGAVTLLTQQGATATLIVQGNARAAA